MELFTKHVNYHDLMAHEAIAIVAVAALAIANGVALALALGVA